MIIEAGKTTPSRNDCIRLVLSYWIFHPVLYEVGVEGEVQSRKVEDNNGVEIPRDIITLAKPDTNS